MQEFTFIKQNIDKWKSYDSLAGWLYTPKVDDLIRAYDDVMADLAYANTQYPDSRICIYLNDLCMRLHEAVYKQRRYGFRAFLHLFTYEIPRVVALNHRILIAAFVIFACFTLSGVILAFQDEANIRNTLGDAYVNMTVENIRNNEPTAVYAGGEEMTSFLGILWNNVRVTFLMFASGLIPFVGPVYFMYHNGVMLGEFQSLFFLYGAGIGFRSMTAIWIHGAFEISSIIIAAGAALTLSCGWMFPGTYSRKQSLRMHGQVAIRILTSVVPLLTVAAFFEGFLTRHVEYPLVVKLLLILGSFGFIIYYYVILPYIIWRRERKFISMEDLK